MKEFIIDLPIKVGMSFFYFGATLNIIDIDHGASLGAIGDFGDIILIKCRHNTQQEEYIFTTEEFKKFILSGKIYF